MSTTIVKSLPEKMDQNFKKILIKTANVLIVLSVIHLLIWLLDYYLKKNEILDITYPYFIVGLVCHVLGAALYFFSGLWKRGLLVLLLGIVMYFLMVLKDFSNDFSTIFAIKNSSYEMEIKRHSYKILEPKFLFKRVVSAKSSDIFFDDHSKTGVSKWSDVELISETPTEMVLKITNRKFKGIEKIKKKQ